MPTVLIVKKLWLVAHGHRKLESEGSGAVEPDFAIEMQ